MRGRRALAAFTLPTVLALAAACGGSNAQEATDPATSAGSTSTSPRPTGNSSATPDPGSSATPVADPQHAVDPPGPRKGALGLADVLVYNGDSLSSLDRRRDPGAHGRAERGDPLAGPGAHREQGDHGGGGRPVDVPQLHPRRERRDPGGLGPGRRRRAGDPSGAGKKLPLDKQGYLRLGSEKDAPAVHIGAYAPQVAGAIDAVVNE